MYLFVCLLPIWWNKAEYIRHVSTPYALQARMDWHTSFPLQIMDDTKRYGGESSMGRIVQRLCESSIWRNVQWAKRLETIHAYLCFGKTKGGRYFDAPRSREISTKVKFFLEFRQLLGWKYCSTRHIWDRWVYHSVRARWSSTCFRRIARDMFKSRGRCTVRK